MRDPALACKFCGTAKSSGRTIDAQDTGARLPDARQRFAPYSMPGAPNAHELRRDTLIIVLIAGFQIQAKNYSRLPTLQLRLVMADRWGAIGDWCGACRAASQGLAIEPLDLASSARSDGAGGPDVLEAAPEGRDCVDHGFTR